MHLTVWMSIDSQARSGDSQARNGVSRARSGDSQARSGGSLLRGRNSPVGSGRQFEEDTGLFFIVSTTDFPSSPFQQLNSNPFCPHAGFFSLLSEYQGL